MKRTEPELILVDLLCNCVKLRLQISSDTENAEVSNSWKENKGNVVKTNRQWINRAAQLYLNSSQYYSQPKTAEELPYSGVKQGKKS